MSSEKPAPKGPEDRMEKIVALAKRRGFIYPSSEIYGGINGFWDYGPLGVELKRNVKDAWWQDMVRCPPAGPDGQPIRMVGLDSAIIMNPKVWEASGHVAGFSDPRVDCKQCQSRYRLDELPTLAQIEAAVSGVLAGRVSVEQAVETLVQGGAQSLQDLFRGVRKKKIDPQALAALTQNKCPKCGGELTEARQFNLMFESHAGALRDEASKVYLRPETAQGIFANYKNVLDTTRLKIPFGIAQIGKAFRNEINPRNFTFRSREFEQMEIEFFCHPSEADRWYEFWRDARFKWYVDQGLKSSKLRLRPHEKDELAHYARACADIEYEFPFGASELEGVANRTDFDLTQHQKFSGRDMTYFDPSTELGVALSASKGDDETKEPRYIPYVIEPSGGVDRATLAFLCEAYDEDTAPDENGKPQSRVVLRFHPRLAPVKVAVFPLVKKDGMPEKARAIYDALKPHMTTFYDEKGAVGRRYRRQDEAGTPFCITVDGETMAKDTVTIRDRDTMKQDRIPSAPDKMLPYLLDRLK
jgi:glycyl-tRNA synthetase